MKLYKVKISCQNGAHFVATDDPRKIYNFLEADSIESVVFISNIDILK
jgi:hypothetical protein